MFGYLIIVWIMFLIFRVLNIILIKLYNRNKLKSSKVQIMEFKNLYLKISPYFSELITDHLCIIITTGGLPYHLN